MSEVTSSTNADKSGSSGTKRPLSHLRGRMKWRTNSSTPTPSTSAGTASQSSTSKSPEPNCAICLGKIEDKAVTDRCFHSFCKTCLQEWSKVKPECPVCRQSFEKIIFNIRSISDYEEQIVETRPFQSGFSWTNLDGIPRFRYGTTLTPLRRRILEFERQMLDMHHHHLHDFTPSHRHLSEFGNLHLLSPYRPSRRPHPMRPIPSFVPDMFPPPPGTSDYRRYIYQSDLWVMTNGDGNTNRYREATASFYAANPSQTHRLIPWLNRELNALMNNSFEIEQLIPRVMDALLKYNITSRQFKRVISPYTLEHTDHFIHEFYNFARSPYDMESFSRIAQYVPRQRAQIVQSEPLSVPIGIRIEPSSSDSDSDSSPSSPSSVTSTDSSVLILSPGREEPTSALSFNAVEPSDVSSTEIREFLTPSVTRSPLSPSLLDNEIDINVISDNERASPTPLPKGDLPDVDYEQINIIDDFDNPTPGTSGINLKEISPRATIKQDDNNKNVCELNSISGTSGGQSNLKEEQNNDDSDSDASSVLIVGYVKPLHERTPEVIDISSHSEEGTSKSKITYKHKKLKKRGKRDKEKHHPSHSKKGNFYHLQKAMEIAGPSAFWSPHRSSRKKCKHKSRRHSRDSRESSRSRHSDSSRTESHSRWLNHSPSISRGVNSHLKSVVSTVVPSVAMSNNISSRPVKRYHEDSSDSDSQQSSKSKTGLSSVVIPKMQLPLFESEIKSTDEAGPSSSK